MLYIFIYFEIDYKHFTLISSEEKIRSYISIETASLGRCASLLSSKCLIFIEITAFTNAGQLNERKMHNTKQRRHQSIEIFVFGCLSAQHTRTSMEFQITKWDRCVCSESEFEFSRFQLVYFICCDWWKHFEYFSIAAGTFLSGIERNPKPCALNWIRSICPLPMVHDSRAFEQNNEIIKCLLIHFCRLKHMHRSNAIDEKNRISRINLNIFSVHFDTGTLVSIANEMDRNLTWIIHNFT